MKKQIVIFFVLCPALLSARTWTAKDGRTILGECVSTTADAVVVARYDGGTVTIPFSMLSDADVAYARESNGQQQADAPNKAPAFPKLRGTDDMDENDRQLEEKYEKLAHMLSDGASPRAVSMFKDALAKDTAYWRQEAKFNAKTNAALAALAAAKPATGKTQVAAEAQQTTAASEKTSRLHARIVWLTKTLPNWLHSVIKAAPAPTE